MRSLALALLVLASAARGENPSAAAAYSSRAGGRAVIIWQDGRILMERYARGCGPTQPVQVYSITKTLCALGAYHALALGWMRLDDPVATAFPEWEGHAKKQKITVRELLNQTSGIAPGYELYRAKDKNHTALKLACVNAPGSTFAYGPSHYEILEAYMERKLKRGAQGPADFISGAIFRPLNIKVASWKTDAMDNPYFSAGMRLSATDLLKVGQMLQRRGWYWIFPLVPPRFLEEAAKGSPANRMYGMGFWTNQNARRKDAVERDVEEAIGQPLSPAGWAASCLSRSAPADLIAIVGSYGQRVYISPSRKLVIVRLGAGKGFRDPEFLNAYFR